MKLRVAAVALLVLLTATACPQKPNPFCPNNVCGEAPTHHSH